MLSKFLETRCKTVIGNGSGISMIHFEKLRFLSGKTKSFSSENKWKYSMSTDVSYLNSALECTQYILFQFFGDSRITGGRSCTEIASQTGVAAQVRLFKFRDGYFTPLGVFYSANIYQHRSSIESDSRLTRKRCRLLWCSFQTLSSFTSGRSSFHFICFLHPSTVNCFPLLYLRSSADFEDDSSWLSEALFAMFSSISLCNTGNSRQGHYDIILMAGIGKEGGLLWC